jgi:hypothetical protein
MFESCTRCLEYLDLREQEKEGGRTEKITYQKFHDLRF